MVAFEDALAGSLITLVLLGVAAESAASPPPASPAASPIPVIFDTDIGDDIDDTWALVMLLRSPDLDVRLISTDYGNTVYRAKIAARLLEVAGRTDIPVAIGIRENEREGGQAEWVRDYDLADFPGTVHEDGVQALIDTVMASPEPLTLIAVGPPPNLAAALEREPRIAGRLRLAGMYGSLRRGYGGRPQPDAEWNVRANVDAARALLAAPWDDAISTPLDTCGAVVLEGERYARIRDSKDPLLQALMDNYRLWCPRTEWCAEQADQVATKSSTLFDTVAVYLAGSRDLVKTEKLGVRVSDDGMTLIDDTAPALAWATEWKNLEAFEDLLVERLTGVR
jgi:inosine-uridine nucleoside N-ribohydrolase